MRCSYCHDGLPEVWVCPGCQTVLHADCVSEAHACPSLGCTEEARLPEPPRRSPARSAGIGLLWVLAVVSLTFTSAQVHALSAAPAPTPSRQAEPAREPAGATATDVVALVLQASARAERARRSQDHAELHDTLRHTLATLETAAGWLRAHQEPVSNGRPCAQFELVFGAVADLRPTVEVLRALGAKYYRNYGLCAECEQVLGNLRDLLADRGRTWRTWTCGVR